MDWRLRHPFQSQRTHKSRPRRGCRRFSLLTSLERVEDAVFYLYDNISFDKESYGRAYCTLFPHTTLFSSNLNFVISAAHRQPQAIDNTTSCASFRCGLAILCTLKFPATYTTIEDIGREALSKATDISAAEDFSMSRSSSVSILLLPKPVTATHLLLSRNILP